MSYEVTASSDSHELDIMFDQYPVSGVYTHAAVTFDALP
jgi:hypothetical protein